MENTLKETAKQMKKNNMLLQKMLQKDIDKNQKRLERLQSVKDSMSNALQFVKRCTPTISFDRK